MACFVPVNDFIRFLFKLQQWHRNPRNELMPQDVLDVLPSPYDSEFTSKIQRDPVLMTLDVVSST